MTRLLRFENLESREMLSGGGLEFYLDQTLGLNFAGGDEWFNWGDQNEKWVESDKGAWYFIEPDGELRQWAEKTSISDDPLIARLSPEVWANTAILWDAQPPTGPPPAGGEFEYYLDRDWGLSLSRSGEHLNWGGRNEKWMTSTSASSGWVFVEPDGKLKEWTGGSDLTNEPVIAQLSPEVWQRTSLLWDANPPAVPPPVDPPPVDPPPVDPPHEGPHADDPVSAAEQAAVMALVPADGATHTAVMSGMWTDPIVWGGAIPTATSKVHIPEELAVVISESAKAQWIRVDGVLDFAGATASHLIVDTIVVTPLGTLRNHATAKSVVTFRDSGPIDTSYDPKMFSRGLISLGTTDIKGNVVTPFVETDSIAVGATQANVGNVVNWQIGDRVLVVGMEPGQDELRTIAAIASGVVTFDSPLGYPHAILTSADGTSAVQEPVIANMTRNIRFDSESTEPLRSGHVVLMHSHDADVEYAEFVDLGRTDKSKLVTDPDGQGNGLENPRGRYPLHAHRMGAHGDPAIIKGVVVDGSQGWGVTNHSSNVLVEDSVSYDVLGAHFVTEIGDEIGAFRNNLAVYSRGDGRFRDHDDDRGNFDWGVSGHGFWIQGGGTVELSGNIASGHAAEGFLYMGLGASAYAIANLPDPSIWEGPNYWGAGMMPADDVPIRFTDNTSFANPEGDLTIWAIHTNHYHTAQSVVSDSQFFGGGITLGYSGHIHFKNVKVIRDVNSPSGVAILNTGASVAGMTYENLHIEGFVAGIENPATEDDWTGIPTRIIGGYYNNVASIVIYNTRNIARTLLIDGTQTFGRVAPEAIPGWPNRWDLQWDIYTSLWFFAWDIRDLQYEAGMPYDQWKLMFESPPVYPTHADDVVMVGSERLSPVEFGDDFDWSGHIGLPDDIRNNTTGSLRDGPLGLWVGGRKLTGTRTAPRIYGLLHSIPPEFRPDFSMPDHGEREDDHGEKED